MFSGRCIWAAAGLLSWVSTATVALGATTTFTKSIDSTTSSLTIPAQEHGFNSTRLAVRVYDEYGVRKPTGSYTFSIDGGLYTVSMTFSPALQSGAAVKLTGVFSGSDTTGSNDFKVTFDSPSSAVKVCASCSDSAFAQRSYNSKVYVQLTPVSFNGACGSELGSCTLFVFVEDNKIKFGIASGGSGTCSGSNCAIAAGVTSYPGGVIQLGRVSYSAGYGWVSVTDDRPAAFK